MLPCRPELNVVAFPLPVVELPETLPSGLVMLPWRCEKLGPENVVTLPLWLPELPCCRENEPAGAELEKLGLEENDGCELPRCECEKDCDGCDNDRGEAEGCENEGCEKLRFECEKDCDGCENDRGEADGCENEGCE